MKQPSQPSCLLVMIALFSLLAVVCGPSPMPTPANTPLAETEMPRPMATLFPEEGLNLLVSQGSVQLKRLAWNEYYPVSFGTAIQRGDLIRPAAGETALILCADLTVHTIDQLSGSPCDGAEPRLSWEGNRIITPRTPATEIPYVLYPRNTSILEARPLLRWHDTGASSYTVSIIESGVVIWQETGLTSTEIRYPDEAPVLNPEAIYLLEVEDDETGISSGNDPIQGLGFRTVSAVEVNALEQVQQAIDQLPLDEATQRFVLALYYASQGVYGEGLRLLDETTDLHTLPNSQRWRGHLWVAMRLNGAGLEAYGIALELAQTADDRESQAQIEVDLWRLTDDEAYLENALALYRLLGDTQSAKVLEGEGK